MISVLYYCYFLFNTQIPMAPATSLAFCLFLSLLVAGKAQVTSFTFNGFYDRDKNLTLDGASIVKPSGLLRLTNTSLHVKGHAFYAKPFQNLNTSFSTYFVFAITPPSSGRGGFGLAFTIAPKTRFPEAGTEHYLGLFNSTNDGNVMNHIFAVEFDTVNGHQEGSDSEGNHVGININGMVSRTNEPAAYFVEGREGSKEDIFLENGDPVQAWIDYNGFSKVVNVTIAPLDKEKPTKPLLSRIIDLSTVLKETMYVGFSSSTGRKASSHYILGWSFSKNGEAPPLNVSMLPSPPAVQTSSSSSSHVHVIIGVLSAVTILLLLILGFQIVYRKYMQFESLEDWELDCPHRFRYSDLYKATKRFKESELIGVGGFGVVYKGVLPTTGNEVAVKKIVRSSIQGIREFAAEIESLGRLRHKNLVNLQGWCKKKNDLLLVYDYIPNGSLDTLLFGTNNNFVLSWEQRFSIIKGIAAGLLYLHEEWEQVVIHRDVKSSNILIDGDMNARLGDFGLARLYDHGQVSHTTNVVGTIGYIAPELTRTGKPSTSTDVYAYGVVLLELATGKRPIAPGQFFLVDWVVECLQMGEILEAVDLKLGSDYVAEEMGLVLKLGLLCTHHKPDERPTMRQVTRYLNGDDLLPEIVDLGSHDSQSSRMGSVISETMSATSLPASYNLSSSINMSSNSIQAGR